MKYKIQGYSYFGWTNMKEFSSFKRAAQSCESLLKNSGFSKTRVAIEENGEYIRVYPQQKDKEGNVVDKGLK